MKALVALGILGFGLIAGAGPATAGAGAHAGSCAGTVNGWGSFTAITNQVAIVQDGRISSENHTHSFSGFLAGMEDAQIVSVDDRHVIYRRAKIDLAIPYVKDAGLYFRNNAAVATPTRSGNWYQLCTY
ncbi:hypothetical protein ACIBJI_07305 [Nocardia sp. NPDC050408]|uniref:hypothetical protein n=1 Tax=Nocardia sp. NPDC050408 TaxID=3364319 RepID=UPI0037A4677B